MKNGKNMLVPESLYESLNFNRGIEPMDAMGTGTFEFTYEDFEDGEELEKRKTRNWKFNDIRVIKLEGYTGSEKAEYDITLSNNDFIEFTSFYTTGPNMGRNFAIISTNKVSRNVTKEYMEELENWGSHILAVLKIYEKMK